MQINCKFLALNCDKPVRNTILLVTRLLINRKKLRLKNQNET